MDKKFDYLKLEYETGFDAVKSWLNARYQMFQMASYLNLGALTLGFQLNLLFSPTQQAAGILISIICLLVTLIGLATEIASRKYNIAYFTVLREIENKLGQIDGKPILDEIGIFNNGRKEVRKGFWGFLKKILVVDKLHMVFYTVLVILWLVSLGYHLVAL
jgi:hypothetical protein